MQTGVRRGPPPCSATSGSSAIIQAPSPVRIGGVARDRKTPRSRAKAAIGKRAGRGRNLRKILRNSNLLEPRRVSIEAYFPAKQNGARTARRKGEANQALWQTLDSGKCRRPPPAQSNPARWHGRRDADQRECCRPQRKSRVRGHLPRDQASWRHPVSPVLALSRLRSRRSAETCS